MKVDWRKMRKDLKLRHENKQNRLSVSSRTMRSIHKTSGQQNKDLQDERRMNPNETL
jgi:ribosomal protein L28